MKKSMGYYSVSLLGLSVSLASCVLISAYIRDEISFDKFHTSHNRIYRVTTHLRLNDVDYNEATSQFPAAQALKSEFPEIEQAVRIYPRPITLELNDKKIDEARTFFVDSNFFRVFSFKVLRGNPATLLNEAYNIVLTSAAAARYFGTEDPVGKELVLANQSLRVTGVVENSPEQSHLKFDILISLEFQLNQWKNQFGLEGREHKWFWTGAYTYLLLNSEGDAPKVVEKLPAFVNKYFPERYKAGNGRFELQALDDIHLRSNLDGEFEPGGSALYLSLFIIVAIVVMLVSAINLINLSHYKIMRRVKEIGIRKFLGQSPGSISFQLVMEGAMVGILAFIVGLAFSQVSLSQFNLLVGKNLYLFSASNLSSLLLSFIVVLTIALTAVLKPAIQYARASAQELLLVKLKRNKTSAVGRNLLIGFQISLSFILLVFTFVIHQQIKLFDSKDLGFQKDYIVVVQLTPDVYGKFKALKTEWERNSNVEGVAGAEQAPGAGYEGSRFVPEGGSYERPLMIPFSACDEDFLDIMRIKLVSGNNFDPSAPSDSLPPLLINRQAAVDLGWTDDAIGRKLSVFQPGTTDIMFKGKVIGLIDDFHSESLHKPIKPLVMRYSNFFGAALIKVSEKNPAQAVDEIEKVWKAFSDRPLTFTFLDRQLGKLYANETKLGSVILFFTLIGLYLTCHGLFAMSSLLFTSKLKDVAVRKVFGASRMIIAGQLYRSYLVFKVAAIAIACPIVFWITRSWLLGFQYRIELSPIFFIEGAAVIWFVGLLSVGYYLRKVAWSNPIKFLRSE